MSNQIIVTEAALSALASDIKTALSGKANSNDVYPKSQTYNREEIDNALVLKADKSELYNIYPTEQESGAIAHFTDGADNVPVKSLVSEIVAVQAGSGVPSPDNVREISGWDECNVTKCGKNLCNFFNDGKVPSVINGRLVNASGCRTNYIKVTPSTEYTLSATSLTSQSCYFFYYDKDYNFLSYDSGSVPMTRTTPSNCCYIILRNDSVLTDIVNAQLELGSTVTEYEAYNGNTYTFTFGQTVYGGHFDNKGNLVITHGHILVNGSETFTMGTTSSFRFFDMSMVVPLNANAWETDIISNIFKKQGQGYPYCQINGTKKIRLVFSIDDTSITSVADLQALLTNTNAQIVYPLATPITLSITSQDIPTLSGVNNIFSNCGDVEVDYHADIGLYIDKKISSLAQG